MDSKIAVSVLCTAYNHESSIARALDGILMQQTNFSFEILITDDASTDSTADIIIEYSKKYPTIIKPILHSENQYSKGISHYSNYLFPRAEGKYIAMCEGDDYWIDPQKLQIQYDFLENNEEYSACIHNAVIFDLQSKIVYLSEKINGDRDKTIDDIITEGGGVINPTASFFFRSGLVDRAWKSTNPPVGDHFTLIELAAQGRVHWMDTPMSVYNLFTESSWSLSQRNKTPDKIHDYHQRYINTLEWMNLNTEREHELSFEDRISLQKDVCKNALAVSEYTHGHRRVLSLLQDRIKITSILKSFMHKYLGYETNRFIARKYSLMRLRRKGTLLSNSISKYNAQNKTSMFNE